MFPEVAALPALAVQISHDLHPHRTVQVMTVHAVMATQAAQVASVSV